MAHEFNGKAYEKASAHQKEWGSKLIEELHLCGDEYVLDLGCGDGSLTSQIAGLLPKGEVLGIDASQGMIDVALTKGCSNQYFRTMDINDLDFEDQFDVVYSNAALHWIKDHRRLLTNVRQALRSKGRLRFNFAGNGNCTHFFAEVREAMTLPEFAPSFEAFEWPWYMPSVDAYRALCEASGFDDIQVWEENADRYFPDEATMIGWIDQPSLVPFLAQLPEAMQSSFRDFVIHRMIERTKQADGRFFETFRRINVFGVKG
jgi:trans-aconitate methyltransferase